MLHDISTVILSKIVRNTYRSSGFHSVSGAVLTPTCGQAGQNKANEPSPALSGRSCATPARIRLWRSLHCLDTLMSSRYRSYNPPSVRINAFNA
jgi:hypothetical protein